MSKPPSGEMVQGHARPVWHQDQAAGLRKLFKPRRQTAMAFVSAMPGAGTTRTLARLGLSLAGAGQSVMLVDEHGTALSAALGTGFRFDLAKALTGDASLEQVLVPVTENLRLLPAARAAAFLAADEAEGRKRLAATLGPVWRNHSLILLDARLEEAGHPLSVLGRAVSHVVLVLSGGTAAVTSSYLAVKRLVAAMPTARLFVLVSRVRGEQEARGMFENLARVAQQHLGVELGWLGWVPLDPGWRDTVATPLAAGSADLACEKLAQRIRQLAGLQPGSGSDETSGLHVAARPTRGLAAEAG